MSAKLNYRETGVCKGSNDAEPDSGEFLCGDLLSGRYRLDECLGEGAMGKVYRGEHVLMDKEVAIKFLHPERTDDAEIVTRFQREAKAAAALDHPNVCRALDFGQTEEGSFFLVLEFLEGDSLREVIDIYGQLSAERSLHIARQIAAGLSEAHDEGIVHRDLKPDNIMIVDHRGDPDTAKITDFGIAHLVASTSGEPDAPTRLTRKGVIYGTPHFMSPEQVAGEDVDARTDIYALGVVLFQMLTGSTPYDGDNIARIMGKHVVEPIPRLSERVAGTAFPDGVQELVDRLMAKDADDRPATAREAIEAIEETMGRSGPQPAGFANPGSGDNGATEQGLQGTERVRAVLRDLSDSERRLVLGFTTIAAIILMGIVCLSPVVFFGLSGDSVADQSPGEEEKAAAVGVEEKVPSEDDEPAPDSESEPENAERLPEDEAAEAEPAQDNAEEPVVEQRRERAQRDEAEPAVDAEPEDETESDEAAVEAPVERDRPVERERPAERDRPARGKGRGKSERNRKGGRR